MMSNSNTEGREALLGGEATWEKEWQYLQSLAAPYQHRASRQKPGYEELRREWGSGSTYYRNISNFSGNTVWKERQTGRVIDVAYGDNDASWLLGCFYEASFVAIVDFIHWEAPV